MFPQERKIAAQYIAKTKKRIQGWEIRSEFVAKDCDTSKRKGNTSYNDKKVNGFQHCSGFKPD